MKVVIEDEVLATMTNHAEEYYPNECCGFFYGSDEGDLRKITLAREVKNAKEGNQRRRFQIDPKDYQEAERYALKNDLDLLGVYHSHPDHPAVPSEHDRKVAMPYFSYIIVSVQDGEAVNTRSWKLNEERQFEEETLETKNIKKKQTT